MRAWGLFGIIIAVEFAPAEKEFESVVAAIVLRRVGIYKVVGCRDRECNCAAEKLFGDKISIERNSTFC